MINFSDITLVESEGQYELTKDIMGDGSWMIRSTATVITPTIAGSFLLHLWDDGNVYIMETDHPLFWVTHDGLSVSDDDIRELSEWRKAKGWANLLVFRNLLLDPRGFEFWLREYRAGLVDSIELKKHDAAEMERLSVPEKES